MKLNETKKVDTNLYELNITVDGEQYAKALDASFKKNSAKLNIPGFRKGKVPKKMIEQMYGKGVFYEDAANALIPEAYEKALEECEETIVSSPKINVTQIEEGKSFIFTAEVALKPEVTLGQYKGVEVAKPTWFFLERYNQAFINQVISFVDAINNDKPVAVGAVDGLRPVLMAKAATESCQAGGVFVKVGE